MKRALRVILPLTLLAALLAIAALELMLRTDWPRRTIEREVADATGMLVSIRSVDAGWLGRTTIGDIDVTLPLEDAPILTIQRLVIDHGGLLGVLWHRTVRVAEADVLGATLNLRRDEQGNWNITQLVDSLRSASAGGAAAAQLPTVSVPDMVVTVADTTGTSTMLAPVTVRLTPISSGAATARLGIADMATLSARFATGGDYQHAIEVDLSHLRGVVDLLPWSELVSSSGGIRWSGRVAAGRLEGGITISDGHCTDVRLAGKATVSIGEENAMITPTDLTLHLPGRLADTVVLRGGSVSLRSAGVVWSGLRVHAAGGAITSSGSYAQATGIGSLDAAWKDVAWPSGQAHQGTLVATVARDASTGAARADVKLVASGRGGEAEWDVRGVADVRQIEAATGDAATIGWRLADLAASWREDDVDVKVSDATGEGIASPEMLTIDNFRVSAEVAGHGAMHAAGAGAYGLHTGMWTLTTDMKDVRLHAAPAIDGTATIRAGGSPDAAEFTVTKIGWGDIAGRLEGKVAWRGKPTVEARYDLCAAVPAADDGATAGFDIRKAWRNVKLGGGVNGTVWPVALQFESSLDVLAALPDGEPQQIPLAVRGHVRSDAIELESDPFTLLGASVCVAGTHDFTKADTAFTLEVQGFDVEQLDPFLTEPTGVTGVVSGSFAGSVASFDPRTLALAGRWSAEELAFADLSRISAAGQIEFKGGQIAVTDIKATSHTGSAAGEVRTDLTQHPRLAADFTFTGWRVDVERLDGHAAISGNMKADIDPASRQASGAIDLKADIRQHDHVLAAATLRGGFTGQHFDIDALDLDFLEGKMRIAGRVDLFSPVASRLTLTSSRFDLSRLRQWVPVLHGIKGHAKIDGELRPSDDPRTPGPAKLTLSVTPDDAMLHRVKVGESSLTFFLNDRRLLLQQATFALADGKVRAWGRLSPRDHAWHGYLNLHWENMGVDQLVSLMKIVESAEQVPMIGKHEADEVPGRFDGHLHITGPIDDWTKATGAGRLAIREADLVHIPLFSEMYRIMNLKLDKPSPDGAGAAVFRLEGGTLIVEDVVYASRGARLNLRLKVADLKLGDQSPVIGVAVGILNPLPVFPVIQKYIDVLMNYEGELTTMRISGTVDKPIVERAPITVFDQLKRDLLGSARE